MNTFFKFIGYLSITKQAFSKARKKLKASAFILLNCKLIEEYYTDNDIYLWNGYRLIAADGSDIQLPQTEEFKTTFGTAKNQNGSSLAMAKISYSFDVLNHLILDAQMDCLKRSERDLLSKHIEAIKALNHDHTKDLYILDRGYPSLGLLFYLQSEGKDFVIRCPISCFSKVKAVLSSGKNDVIVRLYTKDATSQQIAELKKRVPTLDRKQAYIDIRVIILTLNTGEKEILITYLLDQKKYKKEDFGYLYNKRWSAEENYKWHKQVLELENFSGHSKLSVEQNFFLWFLLLI